MRQSTRERNAGQVTAARWSPNWGNFALVLVSTLFSLVLAEIVFRLVTGVPALTFANWRTKQIVLSRMGDTAKLDPVLGWTLLAGIRSDDFNTIDHGIRANFGERTIRTGAILAVGDSFTEGWLVDDDESWPAYLEGMVGTPVVNAGVFAYGTDQIILRAEQLLPVVKPKILIVGFLEYDIFRAAHSEFGAPKPYFTLEDGKLQFHPPKPLDPSGETAFLASVGYDVRDVLGYSALADHLAKRLVPNYWYAGSKTRYQQVKIDAPAVTCALLDRLKRRVDRDGVRMLLFMQHNEYLILAGEHPSENAQRVVGCAEAMGIQVVDQFAPLRAIVVADGSKIREYYMQEEWVGLGHMTPKGNQHAAEILAAALREMKP
jgi:hypothetical protein